jgi:pimeloyl-ACP methyl ester carboxylesterase
MATKALANLFVRPARAEYTLNDLGPKEFTFEGADGRVVHVERIDVSTSNASDEPICASWYSEKQCVRSKDRGEWQARTALIYLHGNASCQRDAQDLIQLAVHLKMSLLALDFSGCGMSGGDFVTLGWKELDDVEAIVDAAYTMRPVDGVVLWGRSMGSVAAIRFAAKHPSRVRALVLDSPFADLYELAKHVVENYRAYVPGAVLAKAAKVGLPLVRRNIVSRVSNARGEPFDIKDLVPARDACLCSAPVIMFHGERDTFVPPSQSAHVFEAYGATMIADGGVVDKRYRLVDGDHNDMRPLELYDVAAAWLVRTLRLCDLGSVKAPAPSMAPPSTDDRRFYLASLLISARDVHLGSAASSSSLSEAEAEAEAASAAEREKAAVRSQSGAADDPLPAGVSALRQVLLCVDAQQGVSLWRPWAHALATMCFQFDDGTELKTRRANYKDLDGYGSVADGTVLFLRLRRGNNVTAAAAAAKLSDNNNDHQVLPIQLYTPLAADIAKQIEANVDALFEQKASGDHSAVLANIPTAVSVLIDKQREAGAKPNAVEIRDLIFQTMTDTLGEQSDDARLLEHINRVVVDVFRERTGRAVSLDATATQKCLIQ